MRERTEIEWKREGALREKMKPTAGLLIFTNERLHDVLRIPYL
jgi:hypothetical protein